MANVLDWSAEMFVRFSTFINNESGATAIEYSLIASLIAVAIIAALTTVTTQLNSVFSEVSTAMK